MQARILNSVSLLFSAVSIVGRLIKKRTSYDRGSPQCWNTIGGSASRSYPNTKGYEYLWVYCPEVSAPSIIHLFVVPP